MGFLLPAALSGARKICVYQEPQGTSAGSLGALRSLPHVPPHDENAGDERQIAQWKERGMPHHALVGTCTQLLRYHEPTEPLMNADTTGNAYLSPGTAPPALTRFAPHL